MYFVIEYHSKLNFILAHKLNWNCKQSLILQSGFYKNAYPRAIFQHSLHLFEIIGVNNHFHQWIAVFFCSFPITGIQSNYAIHYIYAFASIQYMDFGFENACIYEIIAIGFKLYAILLHFINSLRSNAWLHSPQFKGKMRKNEE